jgi:hypothetical protein
MLGVARPSREPGDTRERHWLQLNGLVLEDVPPERTPEPETARAGPFPQRPTAGIRPPGRCGHAPPPRPASPLRTAAGPPSRHALDVFVASCDATASGSRHPTPQAAARSSVPGRSTPGPPRSRRRWATAAATSPWQPPPRSPPTTEPRPLGRRCEQRKHPRTGSSPNSPPTRTPCMSGWPGGPGRGGVQRHVSAAPQHEVSTLHLIRERSCPRKRAAPGVCDPHAATCRQTFSRAP